MNDQTETIKSLLYLHAVIPALEMLSLLDAESRDLAVGLTSPLRLLVGNGEQRILSRENGNLRCGRESTATGCFTLWFPTPHQFLKLVEKRGVPLVIPRSGWLSPKSLKTFSLLMNRLEWYLKPVEPSSVSREELARRVHLQLAVATASVPVLGRLDSVSKKELSHLPSGIVLLSCDPALPSCWVRIHQGQAFSGIGNTPEPPLAEILFTDPPTAYAALGEKLDQMAAVNTGKIRVKGLIPMADGVDLVLSRVSRYLPTT